MYSSPDHAEKMRRNQALNTLIMTWERKVSRAFNLGAVFGFAMGCVVCALMFYW